MRDRRDVGRYAGLLVHLTRTEGNAERKGWESQGTGLAVDSLKVLDLNRPIREAEVWLKGRQVRC
jgi:hypothetical protein